MNESYLSNQLCNLLRLSARDILEEWKYKVANNPEHPVTKPTYVNIEIINRCCLKCNMCDIWRSDGQGELNISDWINIINQLKDWLGTFRLTITGGEPFMKSGVWQLLEHCSSLELPIVVVTSGYCFGPRQLTALLDLKLTQLVISIDSANPDVHDSIRGVKGVHKRAWSAIQFLASQTRPFLLATNTVIMRDNLREIESLARTLHEGGVERIFFQPVQGGFLDEDSSLYLSDLWPVSHPDIEHVFQSLIYAKRTGIPIANTFDELRYFETYFLQGGKWQRPFECTAGRKMFHCDAYGNVRMCVPYPGNIGSLKENLPQQIWSSQMARTERLNILKCRKACMLNCNREYKLSEKIAYGWQYLRRVSI